jgi:hypothetical protein
MSNSENGGTLRVIAKYKFEGRNNDEVIFSICYLIADFS